MGNNINEKIVILCKDTAKITVPECCVEISLECNCTMGKRREIKKIYRTNCDVVQIFPTMSKAVATREKIRLFFTCLIKPIMISCWHVTCLSHHFVELMFGWRSLHYPHSKIFCRNFVRLWLLKHWKFARRQWRSKFSRMGRKPKYGKKNRKLRFQWLW